MVEGGGRRWELFTHAYRLKNCGACPHSALAPKPAKTSSAQNRKIDSPIVGLSIANFNNRGELRLLALLKSVESVLRMVDLNYQSGIFQVTTVVLTSLFVDPSSFG